MGTIPLPQRPANSAGKQVWVNYCAAHGLDMDIAKGMTVSQLQRWSPEMLDSTAPQPEPPPVQKMDTHIGVDGAKHQGPAHPCADCDRMEKEPAKTIQEMHDAMTAEQWREQHPLNIQDAILETMKLVGSVGKNERNNTPGASYSFRGVDTTVNAVAPAFKMFGVTISPKVVHCATSRAPKDTNSGNPLLWADVIMEYTLEARDGSRRVWSAPGAAMDTGDKAIGKACSVAYRIAMLQGLCIPTDEPDPDSFSYGHEDPDGGRVHGRDANRAQQSTQPQERASQRPDYTDPKQGPQQSEADKVRQYTLSVMSEFDWTGQTIRDKYFDRFKVDYLEETDIARMKAWGREVRDDAVLDRAREEAEAVQNVMNGLGGTVIDSDEPIDAEVVPDAGSSQD